MIVCPRCSKDNQDHYKFCLGCGAELPRNAAQPKSFTAPTPPAGMPAPATNQEDDPLMGLTIKLTDSQRDAIYGNHDTSPDTWDGEKALGYIAGQVALARKGVYQLLGEADDVDLDSLADKIAVRVPTADKESVKAAFREWLAEAARNSEVKQ